MAGRPYHRAEPSGTIDVTDAYNGMAPMARKGVPRSERKRINLALQGGGAHGAFTWGVLDELMQDGRVFISGMSGTSAGAMNAAVFIDGFLQDGRQGAVASMERFWKKVSDSAMFSPLKPPPWHGSWNMDDMPAYAFFDLVTRLYSPYQLNPLDLNPLRDILAEVIDFERMRRHTEIRLFVNATNVRTCMPKVFRTPEISVDVLLASACLPLVFQAVEVEGEHYWDGGYMANPSIYPLIHECTSNDVVIVQINPMNRPDVPTGARDILNRMNEINFNATLVREMQGVATVSRLIESGGLSVDFYEKVNFHMIDAQDAIADLGASSKMNAD